MSALDTLERQLRDSARRRRRRTLRLMPAVVALVAAAALFAVLLPRGPEPSDERPATPPAPTWTPRMNASISRSPVPAEQLAALAILRRAPAPADRSPAVRQLLGIIGHEGMSGVRVDAVRMLAQRGSRLTILVPIVSLSRPPWRDVLCLYTTTLARGKPAGAGGTCRTFADLRRHGYLGWPGPPFGLVPDGVASVKLRVRGGKTITAPVRNNVYDLTHLGDGVFAIQPPLWLDANGHEIPRR